MGSADRIFSVFGSKNVTADDGIRANYFRRTLPSHNGQLQENLNCLNKFGAQVAHCIDGTKLYECLAAAKPSVYCGPFDDCYFLLQ